MVSKCLVGPFQIPIFLDTVAQIPTWRGIFQKNCKFCVPLDAKRGQFLFFVQFLAGFCRFCLGITSKKACLDLPKAGSTSLCLPIGRSATVSISVELFETHQEYHRSLLPVHEVKEFERYPQ